MATQVIIMNNKKNTAVFCAFSLSHHGGMALDILKCIKSIHKTHKVHIITANISNDFLNELIQYDCQIHKIKIIRLFSLINRLSFTYQAQKIIASFDKNTNIYCLERLPIGNYKVGLTPYHTWLSSRRKLGAARFSKPLTLLWDLIIDYKLRHDASSHIVVYSNRDKQDYITHGVSPSRISLVRIFTDTERFTPNNNTKKTYITVIGSNPWLKGLDITCEAWKDLESKHPDTKLRIISGNRKAHAMLKKYDIIHRAEILNPTKNIETYYHTSKLVLMPSAFETWGNVVLEALSCGIPIVVSSEVPAKEIVLIDKKLGQVFTRNGKNDVANLKESLQNNLSHDFSPSAMQFRHQSVLSFQKTHIDLQAWIQKQ